MGYCGDRENHQQNMGMRVETSQLGYLFGNRRLGMPQMGASRNNDWLVIV